eukprot:66924-Pelagomonas_calceolata.AAC.6
MPARMTVMKHVHTHVRRNLLKVVFATGTLAAGINMPARTTVISALGRMTDDGPQLMPHNELLQMAGRAGRRGFDTAGGGYCVLVAGLRHGQVVVILQTRWGFKVPLYVYYWLGGVTSVLAAGLQHGQCSAGGTTTWPDSGDPTDRVGLKCLFTSAND